MPPLLLLGIDPLWLCPADRFKSFFLRSVAPTELKTLDIYCAVLSFIAIQLVALALVQLYPRMVTALPAWLNALATVPSRR